MTLEIRYWFFLCIGSQSKCLLAGLSLDHEVSQQLYSPKPGVSKVFQQVGRRWGGGKMTHLRWEEGGKVGIGTYSCHGFSLPLSYGAIVKAPLSQSPCHLTVTRDIQTFHSATAQGSSLQQCRESLSPLNGTAGWIQRFHGPDLVHGPYIANLCLSLAWVLKTSVYGRGVLTDGILRVTSPTFTHSKSEECWDWQKISLNLST